MATRVRLCAALGALLLAAVAVWQSAPPSTGTHSLAVDLRATDLPINTTTIKSPVIDLTDPKPFEPCDDIPLEAIERLGLAYTPPEPETMMRCHYDAGNYQMAIETVIWRTYAQSLPPDAVETTIDGHRAAQFWVMKPTEWNSRWYVTCMVAFQTSYGVIQQSLYYSSVYAQPPVDCMSTNLQRAHELAPYYKF